MKLSIAVLALGVANVAGLEDEKKSVHRLGAGPIEDFEKVLFEGNEEEYEHEFDWALVSDETGEELSLDDADHRRLAGGSFRIRLQCKSSYKWAKMSCSTGGRSKNNRCKDWCMEWRSCKSGADIRIRECSGSSRQKWKLSGGKLQPNSCSKYCVNSKGEKLTKGKCGDFKWTSSGVACSSSRIMSILHRPCRGEPVKCRKLKKVKKAEADSWDKA